jgi:hypothetical protein
MNPNLIAPVLTRGKDARTMIPQRCEGLNIAANKERGEENGHDIAWNNFSESESERECESECESEVRVSAVAFSQHNY